MPIPSEAERKARIEELLLAEESAPRGQRESSSITWRGDRKILPVIKLPLDFVVLNPRSHRIKSQLESNSSIRAVVDRDKFSEQAQKHIATLLKDPLEDYKELMANLMEEKQREPGIITRIGLLVNANRRAVALREIDAQGYIRVAVLPPGATEKEISDLELKLQIQRDFRLDYTFTNLLLFVEDMKRTHGYSDEDAARLLNYAASSDRRALREGAKHVQQLTRILAMIRHLQGRSQGKLPLTYFNDKRQIMIDLDDKNESLKSTDPSAARKMREARFIALLVGADYRPTRSLAGDAIEDHLIPAIEDIDDVGPDLAAMTQTQILNTPVPAGVNDLLDRTDDPSSVTLSPLVDLLASSHGGEQLSVPSDGSAKTIDRESVLAKLRESIEATNDEIRSDARQARSLDGPVELLRGARLKVERALEGYSDVASRNEFRMTKFKYELKRLAQAVRRLRGKVGDSDR